MARLAGQLEQALSTRGVIDQAMGILIARNRCPADHAYHLLAVAFQRNRLTLTDLAGDLVERASGGEPPQDYR